MLRVLAGFICFFMMSSAQAELADQLFVLQGDFALSEQMSVSSIRRYETVDGLTQKGSSRLQELKSKGYACRQNTAVHWTCMIDLPPEPLTDDLILRIKEKWSGLLFSFRTPTMDAEKIQGAVGLESWLVEQKVFVRTSYVATPKIWSQVSYLRSFSSSASRWLIVLGDYREDDSTVIDYLDENTLGILDIFEVSEGNVKLKYFVDLSIARIQ